MPTTPRKSTGPTPLPRKATAMTTAPVVIDYSALSAEDAELAPTRRPRETTVDFGPFIGWLNDSKTRNVGKAITVPEVAGKATASLIRRAAASLDMGVSVQISEPQANGNVSVRFKAKPKRASEEGKPRRPYRKDSMTDAEYFKATREWVTAITNYLTEKGEVNKIATATAKAKSDLAALRAQMKADAEAAKAS